MMKHASGSFAYDVGSITFTVASSVSLVADTDTVNEDATVTVADGDTEDVLEDDTSATTVSHIGTASDSLTSISTSQAITGTYGTLTMYATGAYSYVADQSAADALTAGVSADDVFYYKAAGATTTLTIAVTGIGPLAANDAANVNEDATVAGTASVTGTGVLGNDDGNASYDTESLRVTRVSTDNFSTATTVDDDDNADTIDGTYGTLTIYKTGQYSYTPDNATAQALAQDASVTDTFYYEIKDDGDVNASTATLVFTITGQNDAPTISQTTANNFTEDSTSTGATVGVFDVNDEETADGSLTVTISDETNYAISYDNSGTATVTLTDVGAATVNAGNELPSYTVTVTDGNSSTATATHDPSVTTVNDAPTISQTTANNFTEDSTSTGATVGVFDVNDEETADGSLTVTISDETNYAISYDNSGTATVTLTDVGAATVNAGNELPSYTVTVTDGNSSTATATHDPSVTTVNDDPTIAVSATSTLTEGSVSAGDTVHTFNIADEETADDTLTLTLSNTTYYAVANNDDGTATVTLKAAGVTYLNAGNSLPAYTLTVTDEANNTATATQTPTISLQNDAPTISQTTANNFTEDSTSTGATVGVFDVNDEETADGSLTVTISDETNYAISYDNCRYSDCNVNRCGRGNS